MQNKILKTVLAVLAILTAGVAIAYELSISVPVLSKDIKKGEVSTFLLRSKIQAIEETFANTPLVRCHRTYIVNINKIKILRNEPDGYYIDFDRPELESIPMSKTYSDKIVKKFADL